MNENLNLKPEWKKNHNQNLYQKSNPNQSASETETKPCFENEIEIDTQSEFPSEIEDKVNQRLNLNLNQITNLLNFTEPEFELEIKLIYKRNMV